MRMKTKTRMNGQRGAVLVELAYLLPVFTLLFVGVFDVGRGYYFAMEVSNAARAGAQYGYQSSGTMIDSTGIQNAAIDDAVDVGASGGSCSKSACWSSGYPKSSWGCMCSDGTAQSPSCSAGTLTCTSGTRQVNYVNVQTQAAYTPLIPWPAIPSSITLKGQTLLWAGQ